MIFFAEVKLSTFLISSGATFQNLVDEPIKLFLEFVEVNVFFSFFDSALVDIPCIVSGIGSILLFFFPLTYTLDLLAPALHVHKCTKAHLDFDPQLLSVIVYVHQITFYH